MLKTSNKNARNAVESKQEFRGANTFGEWSEIRSMDNANPDAKQKVYAVYSYGYHFPLFVYRGGQWYFNRDKYSVTTSKHRSQLVPLGVNSIEHDTATMKELISH